MDKYLEAIVNAPISVLPYEYGIYNDYPILVDASVDKIASLIEAHLDFSYVSEFDTQNTKTKRFNYNLSSSITLDMSTMTRTSLSETVTSMEAREQIEYHTLLKLGIYRSERVGNIYMKEIAAAVAAIGNLCKDNDIAVCFLNSRGWDHLDEHDRTVAYTPRK